MPIVPAPVTGLPSLSRNADSGHAFLAPTRRVNLTIIRPQFLWPIIFHKKQVALDASRCPAYFFEHDDRRFVFSKGCNKGGKGCLVPGHGFHFFSSWWGWVDQKSTRLNSSHRCIS